MHAYTELIPHVTGAAVYVTPIVYADSLEAVVVPVGNRGGSGYANVMRACRTLNTRTWFLVSYARDLLELSPAAWSRRWRTELALAVPARLFAVGWRVLLLARSRA